MIVVVGSLNLDLVATVTRLPAPGETVLARGYAEHAGGKGANQAVAAARAGGRVAMVGRVGRDDAGTRLRDGLAAEGIDVAEVRAVDAPTGRALIEVDDDGQNRIVVVAGANHAWGPDDLPRETLARAELLVLQREVPDAVVAEAVRQGSAAGARVVLNLAPAGEVAAASLREVDVLVVNASEAAALLQGHETAVAQGPDDAARRLAEGVRGDVVDRKSVV
jgi:ribokinase